MKTQFTRQWLMLAFLTTAACLHAIVL